MAEGNGCGDVDAATPMGAESKRGGHERARARETDEARASPPPLRGASLRTKSSEARAANPTQPEQPRRAPLAVGGGAAD